MTFWSWFAERGPSGPRSFFCPPLITHSHSKPTEMKHALLALMLTATLSAQAQITVESNTQQTADGQTTFHVDIPQNTRKTTEKPWLKYSGKGSKGKSSEVNGQYVQLGAVNRNISSSPFDLTSTLVEAVDGVRLSVWLTRDGAAFIAKESVTGQDLAVKKYLHDFAVDQYRCAVKDELKAETSKLKTMEKSLASVIKEGERSGETINRNVRSGQRTTDAMTKSEGDIANKTERIEGQRDMVDATASDPNANAGAKETLDEMKDDKKDLQKLNESQGRELDDLNKDTRAAERNLTSSAERLADMQAKVAVQRTIVADVKAKLAAIK
jgi:hypothetical protein